MAGYMSPGKEARAEQLSTREAKECILIISNLLDT